jgi:hypothetical protein
MKSRLAFPLLALWVCILSGCYLNGHLYPVQGPLAAQTPPPVFNARMSGAFNSGSLTVTLTNGEVCKGAWSMVNQNQPAGAGSGASSAPNLSSAWDAVYGQGFYTAHILGAKLRVQGVLTGNKGTILHVELSRPDTPNGLNEIKGVGADNNGNVYKLAF